MRTLYLHIGTEKTGTTSIQNFLNENRMALSENGYHVLKCAGKKNHRAIASYCMADNCFDDFFLSKQIDNLEKQKVFRKKVYKDFNEEMESLENNIHSVIITSEHFHSRLKSVTDVERLKILLSSFFSEIVIICYLREQSALAASLYSTGIKYGINTCFSSFLKNCSPENIYYNYHSLLERWSNVFSSNNLIVREFSQNQLYNNDLIEDFCITINEDLLSITSRQVNIENESLSNFGIIIGRAINSISSKHDENGFINQERKQALKNITQDFSGHENNVTIEQYEKIYKAFQETNQIVAKKYFKNREALFPWNPLPSSSTPINEGQVTALANIVKDFKNVPLDSELNVNLFRDAAILLQEIDITVAYKLMKLAEKGRPSDQLIKNKIQEYGGRLKRSPYSFKGVWRSFTTMLPRLINIVKRNCHLRRVK